MVNPDWLTYFQRLAQTLNVTTAAELAHISPQAMSNALAGLEAHYQTRLVERGRRLTGLTPAGEALLDEIPGILSSLENADRRLARIRTGEPEGPLSIASVSYVNNYMLPPLMAALTARRPKLVPRLYTMRGDDVEHWVAMGKLDAGILTRPTTRPDLDAEMGLETPYLIVGKPQPKKAWHELGYVTARPFQPDANATEGCASEQHLGGPWPEGKFDRHVVAETDDFDTAISLAMAGVGACFLPELAVRGHLAEGRLAVIADAPGPYSDRLYVVWRKGVRLQPDLRAALSALKTPEAAALEV